MYTGMWNISAPMTTAPELADHMDCSFAAREGYFTLLLVRQYIAPFLASIPPLRLSHDGKLGEVAAEITLIHSTIPATTNTARRLIHRLLHFLLFELPNTAL